MYTTLRDELDKFLGNTVSHVYYYDNDISDIKETKDGVYLKLELPGVEREDVKVSIKDRRLSIKATKKNGKDFKYEKVYRLNDSLDTDKLKASLSLGILNIKIPYKEERKEQEIKIE